VLPWPASVAASVAASASPPVAATAAGAPATARARDPHAFDEAGTRAQLDRVAGELMASRRQMLSIVTRLAPMATQAELDEAVQLSERALAESRAASARFGRTFVAALARFPERPTAAQQSLLARARGCTFVAWSQVECNRKLCDMAQFARAGSTCMVAAWTDASSPLAQAVYGPEGVPLVAAYLDACLVGLRQSVAPGGTPGPEIAELLEDLQLVGWASSQAGWDARGEEPLAPHVSRFKSGLGDLAGQAGLAVRWTAWCLWSWSEAGRAQGNGRFYRKSSLDGLLRLQQLVPAARDRLGQLTTKLRSTWGDSSQKRASGAWRDDV
jgi:hypothetical protein